jgi:hypothetical protein
MVQAQDREVQIAISDLSVSRISKQPIKTAGIHLNCQMSAHWLLSLVCEHSFPFRTHDELFVWLRVTEHIKKFSTADQHFGSMQKGLEKQSYSQLVSDPMPTNFHTNRSVRFHTMPSFKQQYTVSRLV